VKHPANVQIHGAGPLTFSCDCKLLATAGFDETVRVWEVATAKEMHCFSGGQARIHAVAFSPDGKTVASAGGDSTVLVWDLSKRK
jgi:WD40 repeat protein